jgi:short-subunit dehydrogenase
MKKHAIPAGADRNLSEKTVVITGASSGAGRAIALEFAARGATVILGARRADALEEVVQECRQAGGMALAVPTDVTSQEAVERLAAAAAGFGGAIDVWVNNAGVLAAGSFAETPIEVSARVIKTNLLGYMHGAHAVIPYFKQQGYGTLINNISVGGWFPVPYMAGYSASKFGLRAFSEALKGELRAYPHIHVCDLYPGFLDTPGIQHAGNYTGAVLRPAPPVYDPARVARAAVALAIKPKSTKIVGASSAFLKLSYLLFPGFSRLVTGKVIDSYLRKADKIQYTDGNLFKPLKFGTSVSGGWNLDAIIGPRRKRFAGAVMMAGAAGALLLLLRKM